MFACAEHPPLRRRSPREVASPPSADATVRAPSRAGVASAEGKCEKDATTAAPPQAPPERSGENEHVGEVVRKKPAQGRGAPAATASTATASTAVAGKGAATPAAAQSKAKGSHAAPADTPRGSAERKRGKAATQPHTRATRSNALVEARVLRDRSNLSRK